MARAVWSGQLSFGLVAIPIKLYPATHSRDVRFHELAGGRRVRHQRVVELPAGTPGTDDSTSWPAGRRDEGGWIPWEPESPGHAEPIRRDGDVLDEGRAPLGPPTRRREEIDLEDIEKAYEVAPGAYVTVTREELDELRPAADRTIEIEAFVDLHHIDPVHFEKSYWVAPSPGSAAEKPYALLFAAMERAQRVAVGRFVMRTKEYLAAIRPAQGVLALETLYYADEVRNPSEIWGLPVRGEVAPRELGMAEKLIGLLATDWDPAQWKDEYRERVLDLIRSKSEGLEIVAEEPAAVPMASVGDLMAALKASVEAVRDREGEHRTG